MDFISHKKIRINLQLFRNQQWVMNLKALASIKMNSSPNSNNAKLKWTRMRKRTGLPHEGFWLLQVTEIGKNSSCWYGPGSELGPTIERQNVSIHFWHVCLFFLQLTCFQFFAALCCCCCCYFGPVLRVDTGMGEVLGMTHGSEPNAKGERKELTVNR